MTPLGLRGGYLLSHFRSTIGVVRLNFSVRNGKRWDPHAMTTLVSCSPDFRGCDASRHDDSRERYATLCRISCSSNICTDTQIGKDHRRLAPARDSLTTGH